MAGKPYTNTAASTGTARKARADRKAYLATSAIALCLFLVAVILGVGSAFADESAAPTPLPDILPPPASGAPNALDGEKTNPEAAEELPHADHFL